MNVHNLSELFAIDVFDESKMKKYLTEDTYAIWKACVDAEEPLPLNAANEIAEAMKDWAIEKGATHYTHWFQPMNGITAEKHEAFLSQTENAKAILSFSGKSLIQGESDASSFPNGGLRSTFEARGITCWDPAAFAFLLDGSLYIPTCFFTYHGASLDKKTPLLRSVCRLSNAVLKILRLFGDTETQKVTVCVGAEQEYFLLPKSIYQQREDLLLTGRTLFGSTTSKGSESDSHYYGAIPFQVSQFMKDLDNHLWRLGIPSKTKHNEAAPCQYELAPEYTDARRACDNDQLIMLVMKKIAEKHNLVCLLHEKPFAGINGSGKHNNWSLATDSGRNLFSPGNTPAQNAQFLVFLTAFISGVDKYQNLLRASVAYAGNDHRLGGCEAPPAIISIFLGDELTAFLLSIANDCAANTDFQIGINEIPVKYQAIADRNRTSPLAFTGNKFEFRMGGASQSIADLNTILNTIMTEELEIMENRLSDTESFQRTLDFLIKQRIRKHQRILFNGNGYSEKWRIEANKRGLHHCPSTAEALSAYLIEQNRSLMLKHHIYSQEEYHARYEVYMDTYRNTIYTEARILLNMNIQKILPAVLAYTSSLCQMISVKEAAGCPHNTETEWLNLLSKTSEKLYEYCKILEQHLDKDLKHTEEYVHHCHNNLIPTMELIRTNINLLEQYTARSYWPFPNYSEILFH